MTEIAERYEKGDYLETVPHWHEGDSAWKAGKVHDMLAKHRLFPRSIADVGCGVGEVLAQLQKRIGDNCFFTGYDISPQAIELAKARENARLKFQRADFLSGTADRAEMILLLDVFEHVENYLAFLRALSGRASWFVFHIPLDINAGTVMVKSKHMMFMRKTFGHIHYFTAETALATLTDTGYEIIDTAYTWDHERGRNHKLKKTPAGVAKYALQRALYVLESSTNRAAPAFWARLRQQYSLLVLARPRDSH